MIKSMVFFPEVFGNNSDKFNRLALWLVTDQSIVCPNIRDVFTAGGRADLTVNDVNYFSVPRIFKHLYENRIEVAELINDSDTDELSAFWKMPVTDTDKFPIWRSKVSDYAVQLADVDIKILLRDLFSFYL